MIPFHMLCQLSLSVNAIFYNSFPKLMGCYIYSWYCWYCVLSSIACPPYLYAPPPSCWRVFPSCLPLLSTRSYCPSNLSPFLSILPSDNDLVCWWNGLLINEIFGIVISGIFGIVFYLFLQPSVLLMHPFCLSCQCVMLYDVLLMCTFLCFVLLLIDR